MPKKDRNDRAEMSYTTFHVAKMLGVAPPTIVNWCNAGLIKCHRTAGGQLGAGRGHRRILPHDLLQFCETAGYPVPAEVRAAAVLSPRTQASLVIVDDDADFTRVAAEYLVAKAGFKVAVVHHPFDAGREIERLRPAVVLLDLRMPGMDGFEVLRKIRQDPEIQRTLVIACTAFRDATVEDRARHQGFDDYYEKSTSLGHLSEMIDRLIASIG